MKKKKLIITAFFIIILFCSPTMVIRAEDASSDDYTEGSAILLIEENISLQDSCEVIDTDGETHIFPEDDSPSKFLGICVLKEALENGYINDFTLTNSSLGLYVQSVNGIEPSDTEYWALWLNDGFTDCGISCLPISEGDKLSFILTDWMTNLESSKINFNITELVSSVNDTPAGNGGGGTYIPIPTFSVSNAINYLQSIQSGDGSFGGSILYTDWTAIAFGSMGITGSARENILNYFNSNNTLSSLLTDNERHAMALLALRENPYSFNGVNYIGAIIENFDGTQFGDADLINDDIFALIPLYASGYDSGDKEISKSTAFIISKQKTNGSWENSVDITAAAIQALRPFQSLSNISSALAQAENYLIGMQNSDGGWGNVSATSWAMQAESALNASWIKNGKSGLDYLATQQVTDGAVSPSSETLANRIWTTSYAIPAGLGKPWSEILQSVSKPTTPNPGNSGSSNNFVLEEETIPEEPLEVIEESEIVSTPEPQIIINTPVAKQPQIKKQSEETLEITPDVLTANTIDSTSGGNNIPDNLPMVLGTASGILLLGIALKLFIFV